MSSIDEFELGQLIGNLRKSVDDLIKHTERLQDSLSSHEGALADHRKETAAATAAIRVDLAQAVQRVAAVERLLAPDPEYLALPAHREPSDPSIRLREPSDPSLRRDSNPNLQRVSGPHPVVPEADVLNIKADGTTTVRMAKVSAFIKNNLPTLKWILILLLGGAVAFGDKAKALLALLRGP